jgi:hypothetical protein
VRTSRETKIMSPHIPGEYYFRTALLGVVYMLCIDVPTRLRLALGCAVHEGPEGGGGAISGAHIACNGRGTFHPCQKCRRSRRLSCGLYARCIISGGANFTLADSSLLGWWSVYQAGFLHRDISIGNVLMAKQPFISRKSFSFDTVPLLANALCLDAWRSQVFPVMMPLLQRRRSLLCGSRQTRNALKNSSPRLATERTPRRLSRILILAPVGKPFLMTIILTIPSQSVIPSNLIVFWC